MPLYDSELIELMKCFSGIGQKNKTGLERLALSDDDYKARSKLIQLFNEKSLYSYTDAIGNVFGLVNPTSEKEPLVLLGSHLDTQPDGGRFDGQVGVLAALVAVCRLRDNEEIPPGVNLGIVNWTNEEGARFQPSVMGSSVFTGQLPLTTALKAKDLDGVTVADEINRLGIVASDAYPDSIAAYAELHVEQGRVLENEETSIGIVDGTWAAYKADVDVYGVQTHTGPTPMKDRVDAMYGAARLITFVHELGLDYRDGKLHTSVAWAEIYPNSPNATPSRVSLKVELRSAHEEVLHDARSRLDSKLREIENQCGVRYVVQEWSERAASTFDEALISGLEKAVSEAGLVHRRMLTIAGHDAVALASAGIPSALMFIPSHNGVTHNSMEFTSDADLVNGEQALIAIAKHLMKNVAVKTLKAVNY